MKLLIHIILLTNIFFIFAQDPPEYFQFNQSQLQAFYYFESVTINGTTQLAVEDWVGAFNEDVCVGARQWDISLCGGGVCDVPVYGYDGAEYTTGYMMSNDIPTFKIFDASEESYFDAFASEDIPWNNLGMPFIDNLNVNIDLSNLGTGHIYPDNYYISNVYPNPFNPVTNIEYSLSKNSNINLIVYNIHGKQIQVLVNGFQTAGYHSINWNASNYPSGVYFIRLASTNHSILTGPGNSSFLGKNNAQMQKVVLIK